MSEHELWNELGNLYFLSGTYDSAIHAYTKAIELDGKFGRPYSNMALAHIQKGQYDRAIELLRRGTDLLADPRELAVSWNRLGNVYRHCKDYYMALVAYQKADEVGLQIEREHDQPGWDADAPLTITMAPLELSAAEEPEAPQEPVVEMPRAVASQETAPAIANQPPAEHSVDDPATPGEAASLSSPPFQPEDELYDFEDEFPYLEADIFGDKEFFPPEPTPVLEEQLIPAGLPEPDQDSAQVLQLPASPIPPQIEAETETKNLFSLELALREGANPERSLLLTDFDQELLSVAAVNSASSLFMATGKREDNLVPSELPTNNETVQDPVIA